MVLNILHITSIFLSSLYAFIKCCSHRLHMSIPILAFHLTIYNESRRVISITKTTQSLLDFFITKCQIMDIITTYELNSPETVGDIHTYDIRLRHKVYLLFWVVSLTITRDCRFVQLRL